MRVIAGERRGRRLLVPPGLSVRPPLARVKTSLFDILASRGLVDGAQILDLFAGSGALGIEALSRGAESVVFVERDHTALRVLEENLAANRFETRSSIVPESCSVVLPRLARRAGAFDGVFVDPPYDSSGSTGHCKCSVPVMCCGRAGGLPSTTGMERNSRRGTGC